MIAAMPKMLHEAAFLHLAALQLLNRERQITGTRLPVSSAYQDNYAGLTGNWQPEKYQLI